MRALGHERFGLIGHDRGAAVALRLVLDHPSAVTRVAFLDGLPISEHLKRADARFATAWWHWFLEPRDTRAWSDGDRRRLEHRNP